MRKFSAILINTAAPPPFIDTYNFDNQPMVLITNTTNVKKFLPTINTKETINNRGERH